MSKKTEKKDSVPEKTEIRFKYVYPDKYNTVHANGVWGGFSGKGEFNLNFFFERQPVPKSVYYELNEDGTLGNEIKRDPDDHIMIRYITTGVTLSYNDAISVYNWLGQKIKEFEKSVGIEKTQMDQDQGLE